LVQLCHGSPGFIPLFVEAYNVFKEFKNIKPLLVSLLKAGENVWIYGILKKGFGICHGIYGSAYMLLSIFRLTNDYK
jgi:hypothetical protein